MDGTILYLLIVCAAGQSCDRPLGPFPSLSREECLERLQLIRFGNPDKRVVCRTYQQTDIIDSKGIEKPRYIQIAPQDSTDMPSR